MLLRLETLMFLFTLTAFLNIKPRGHKSCNLPCGRALLRPGVIMNCERTLGVAVALRLPRCRNTEPLELLAANSVVRSLKVISLKGPLPRTADQIPR